MDPEILTPRQLKERGLEPLLGTQLLPSPSTAGVPIRGEEIDLTMPLQYNRAEARNTEMYTAEEDVTEELPDGRLIQVAVKGAQMPMREAVKLGLVKPKKEQGPSETKPAQGPSEAKEPAEKAPEGKSKPAEAK